MRPREEEKMGEIRAEESVESSKLRDFSLL